jgi:hypothetical protein
MQHYCCNISHGVFEAPIKGHTIFVGLDPRYRVVDLTDARNAVKTVAPSPAAGLVPIEPGSFVVVECIETGLIGSLGYRDVSLHPANMTAPVLFARLKDNGTPTGAIEASVIRSDETDTEVLPGNKVVFKKDGWSICATYEALLATIRPGEGRPLYYEIDQNMINDRTYDRYDFVRRISFEPSVTGRGPLAPGAETVWLFGPYGNIAITYDILEEIIASSRRKLCASNNNTD